MKSIAIYLILTCCTLSHAQPSKRDTWQQVKTSGKGTLSIVFYSQPGLIFQPKGEAVQGLCVDIMNDFVIFLDKKYNVNLSLYYDHEEKEFSSFLKYVQTTSAVLGVSNVTITAERKKILKFAPAFMVNPIVLLTHKSAPQLTDLNSIEKMFPKFSATVIKGSTHERYIDHIKKIYYPQLKINYKPSGVVIMNDIASDATIFTVMDLTEFMYAIKKQLPLKRQPVQVTNDLEELGFIMNLNSDWDEPLKEFLNPEYLSSTKYKSHVIENLGEA
jgi:ABC-type amino acid transport substrate-binding protein